MKIPENRQWTQTNDGDIFGILHETENISFDKNGKLLLSKKAFNRYNSDDAENLDYPLGIVYYDNQYLGLTSGRLYQFDFGAPTVTELSVSGTSTNSDIVVCYGLAYISTNNNLASFNGNSVSTGLASLTSTVPHPMTVFESKPTYKLAVGNGNKVGLYNSSHTKDSTNELTLPVEYQVTTIAYRNNYLYVGTKHLNGGEAKVFIWNGLTKNFTAEVPTGSRWVFSVIPYGSSAAYITDQGQLMQINGTVPTELANLPVYYQADAVWQDDGGVEFMGKVIHRGMVTLGDDIYINLSGVVDSGFIPEMKSGIWVYNPRVGLTHRAYHSVDKSASDGSATVSTDTITTSSAHGLKTGDPFFFTSVGSTTNITINSTYYASVESTTTFKFAKSRKSLKNGNFVTVGNGGTVGVRYTPNTDIGAGYNGTQGPVALTTPIEPAYVLYQSPIVWGANFTDLAGADFNAFMTLTDSWNVGRITTQRIYSSKILDTWNKLFAFVDGINLSTEKIIIKKKSISYTPETTFSGVWLNSTQINSSSTYSIEAWDDIEVGDEITIINGYGRGYTAHVTEIGSSDLTNWIVLDEAIGTANGAVTFYVDKFEKVASIDNTRKEMSYIEAGITEKNKSNWIQLKLEMRGFGTEVSQLDLTNVTQESS